MSFPYKHFLIIGATSGIGRAMAERLVENGAKVIVVGRRKDRLDEFVAKHGADKASSIVFDISQLDKIPQFANDVIQKYPDLDSVWLNAGFQRQYNLANGDWDFESFQNEFRVNVFSIVGLARAFTPYLTEKAETGPASLIFTGTNLTVVPFVWAPGYSASKSALNVYTISLREQLKGKSKVKVIEVMPPAVQTELHDYMGEKGAQFGMPIDQFTDEAFRDLQAGLDQVVVGHLEPREVFFDILEKKRKAVEGLADATQEKTKAKMAPIPITILTGFLGSGKTTLLLNLLPQLPKSYKLALLKNEFGDVAIDSQLASTSAISGVRELLNGCICCNLVGQLSDALTQLRTEISPPPDRIIIETSGSAFPATLAMEVNRLARESPKDEGYILDGVVSVIDVENWQGYEDTSYTAKLQAQYTDLIVFNKWESVGERRFDEVLDRVGDLGVETAWVKSDKGRVEKEVLLGIDGALVAKEGVVLQDGEGAHGHEHEHKHDHQSEVEVLSLTLRTGSDAGYGTVDVPALERLLSTASKEEVYRIKGILRTSPLTPLATSSDNLDERPAASEGEATAVYYILNWAFGRWTCTPSKGVAEASDPTVLARITLILARYESAKWKKKLEAGGLVRGDGGVGELSVERLV
ncbi:hypothetical protein BJX63DRAFT_424480 [Aspergillus granulosus]|uniref:CobW/HypB/UreG nucleotide-binding domain-containing protein n=1 Tax=Aspergillus granulosus TaxID=176169 RepID=A0ABR4GZM2_9EURO